MNKGETAQAAIERLEAEGAAWKTKAEGLAKLGRDLLRTVTQGPCCGSSDENTSHYHCPKCGEVGGMYVHMLGEQCPRPDAEYQRTQKLPEIFEKACDEILGVNDCDHGVTFDPAAAAGLDAYEIKKRWPRLDGLCPKGCGYCGIAYASERHYYAGDW